VSPRSGLSPKLSSFKIFNYILLMLYLGGLDSIVTDSVNQRHKSGLFDLAVLHGDGTIHNIDCCAAKYPNFAAFSINLTSM
jgi:hypothetical protein